MIWIIIRITSEMKFHMDFVIIIFNLCRLNLKKKFEEFTSLKKIIYKNDKQNIEIMDEFTFLGDINVRKTCFTKKYKENVFIEEYDPTFIANCMGKKINFKDSKINIMIWDVSGDISNRILAPIYSHGIIGFYWK